MHKLSFVCFYLHNIDFCVNLCYTTNVTLFCIAL